MGWRRTLEGDQVTVVYFSMMNEDSNPVEALARIDLSRLKEVLETALNALLDDLSSLNIRWTRDQFEEWLQSYLIAWQRAKLIELPAWRAYSTLDDTCFLFHIQFDNYILAMAITQAVTPPPDYLAITREIVCQPSCVMETGDPSGELTWQSAIWLRCRL